ncbi:protein phosphatase 2C domain-containing protein [uncultured Thiodictyon sp.]|uniref:PP2C family protein-serine/threonine phosphatase n=1 Tax=uncultured Thiodictyon sp. TaxID=1846217 RepID=UPI0025E160C5|nr:protein phosphatase 2C domain-containing protein [uncultured Thiodictyon sp.]
METPITPYRWTSGGLTDPGRRRKVNQDNFLDRPDLGLWAVADGMGGHRDGGRASRTLVEALATLPRPRLLGAAADAVRGVLTKVNRQLAEETAADGGDVVGSTIVTLIAVGDHCGILWVGDSRAYRLRDGVMTRVSRDHTQVQALVDQGVLAPEQAEHHPYSNVLARAIGAESTVEIDTLIAPLRAGDRYLLCSDGLDKEVSDAQIAAVLADGAPGQAAQALVERACEAGGRDNVTAVVVQFDSA